MRDWPEIKTGDVVEHVMNTNVFGVVLGFMGTLVAIRAAPSLNILWFHEWELMPVEPDGYEHDAEEQDNVIDFTKARDLRTAKAKGAA